MPTSPRTVEGVREGMDAPGQRLVTLIDQEWSGPLPPPTSLQRYEEIVPGGAARIFHMAEIQQAHRFQCEAKALEAENSEAKLGLLLGGAVALCSVILSVVAVLIGAHWSLSIALVSVPVFGMVRTLIQGRRGEPKSEDAE